MKEYEFINALQASETAPALTEWEQRIANALHEDVVKSVRVNRTKDWILVSVFLFLVILFAFCEIKAELDGEESKLLELSESVVSVIVFFQWMHRHHHRPEEVQKWYCFKGRILERNVRYTEEIYADVTVKNYEHYVNVCIDEFHAVRNVYLPDKNFDNISPGDEIIVMYYPGMSGQFYLFGKKI